MDNIIVFADNFDFNKIIKYLEETKSRLESYEYVVKMSKRALEDENTVLLLLPFLQSNFICILYIDDGYFVGIIFNEKFNITKFVLNASYKHPTKNIFFSIDEETLNKLYDK